MNRIHTLFTASLFTCNILSAAAPEKTNNAIDYRFFNRAVVSGDIKTAQNFLRENVNIDINHKSDWTGWTPLHLASTYGRTEMVRLLLDREADVDSKSYCDETPLHFAAHDGNKEVIELLLGRGARTDIKDITNTTAAEVAKERGHPEIAQLITLWNANDGTEIKEPEVD